MTMTDSSSEAMLATHREMLIDGLRSVFGDFDPEMLQRVLPQLEWVQIGGGEILFSQGTQDESLYFVISGRLRAFTTHADGGYTTLGEVARGETVGEMAFFTGEPRTATITAVRDSVLARFSKEVFRELLLAYPLVSLNMTRLVIERLKRVSERKPVAKPVTIGIGAITSGVDADVFARQLLRMLAPFGRSVVVSSRSVDRSLGEVGACHAPPSDGERSRRLARLLEEIESEHQFVLFVADAEPTGWTRRCLRHCDEILLVADADQPETLHAVEAESLSAGRVGRGQISRTLVLLHPDDRQSPRLTRRWFVQRQLTQHLHVRRGSDSDWQRLGRIVSGNAVGLVLSGGGARGFSHLGVLKALRESGITFDMVGGTSMGAAMGAYAAMDMPVEDMIQQVRNTFRGNPTGDYNLLPLISLISGRRLKKAIDRSIAACCGEHVDIEDLWIGYFCVSSNYSLASEAVQSSGPLARCVRASVSIPGALPPVMIDGELHIDGGTFNNFPTDVMRRRGASRIIGVNLLRDRNQKFEFDEVPGTLALLRDKFRRRKKYRLPSLTSLLLNTSIMYSYARQQESQAVVDLYFSPPVHRFGMLEWSAFDRVVEGGYQHAQQELARLDPEAALGLRNGGTPAAGVPEWATATTRIMRRAA